MASLRAAVPSLSALQSLKMFRLLRPLKSLSKFQGLRRIVVTFMAAFDVGDAVAVPASCYPCYRNLLQCYGCELVTVAVSGIDSMSIIPSAKRRSSASLTLALDRSG